VLAEQLLQERMEYGRDIESNINEVSLYRPSYPFPFRLFSTSPFLYPLPVNFNFFYTM